MIYAVVFEKAPHNWAAYVPALPGCVTTGPTLEATRLAPRWTEWRAGQPEEARAPGLGDRDADKRPRQCRQRLWGLTPQDAGTTGANSSARPAIHRPSRISSQSRSSMLD